MLNNKRFILLLFIGFVFCIDVFAQSKDPILLSVRGGSFVLADLIGPDPADTGAVIVEVKGARRSFKLDEVRILPQARKHDAYGNLHSNDEKARLDSYAIELQNNPGSSAYVIVYGTCLGEGRPRTTRIKDYLVNSRGLDGQRVITLDDTCRTRFLVELWIVPGGADPPRNTEAVLKSCRPCPKPKSTRKRRRK